MNEETFKEQMDKLVEGFGERTYSKPRLAQMWEVLRTRRNEFMIDAVAHFFAYMRSAPLLKDFLEFEEKWRRQKAEQEANAKSAMSIGDILSSKVDTSSNPDFAKECVALWQKFIRGQIDFKQYKQACDMLDVASGVRK